MWKHRRRVLQVAVLIGIVVGAYWLARPPKPPALRIHEDVTRITGPLDAEGYIDFEAALNERLSAGVTPDNNAAVPLWQAIGPKPSGNCTLHPDFWVALGIEPPPEEGKYFQDYSSWEKHRQGLTESSKEISQISWKLFNWEWYRDDEENLSRWLVAQSEAFEKLRQASLKPKYYSPVISRDSTTGHKNLLALAPLACSYSIQHIVHEALLIRALFSIKRQDYERAWEDVMTCQRLARLLSQGVRMEWITGSRIHCWSAIVLAEILHSAPWSETKLSSKLEEWEKLPSWKPFIEAIERDQLIDLSCLEATRKNGQLLQQISLAYTGHSYKRKVLTHHTDWNSVYTSIRQFHKKWTELYKRQETELRPIIENMQSELKEQLTTLPSLGHFDEYVPPLLTDQQLVAIFAHLMFPSIEEHLWNDGTRIMYEDLIRTSFALTIYRHGHGQYPESLDKLQLKKVPLDPKTKQPITYRRDESGYSVSIPRISQGLGPSIPCQFTVPRPPPGPKPPAEEEPES
jgi:hypothetical protein